jgi:pSer/pThr/pTyr-binding forkhead associated (FHA) protein
MSFKPHGELVPVGGGDTIQLVRDVLSMGRRESCDICIRYPNVSGVHAELHFRDGYWRIRDLNSTNGVKVNGLRVTEKLLHPDDEISISKRRFTIHYELPALKRALEEMEEDVMSQSLLEKAGLEKPRRRREGGGQGFEAADFLLDDE